MIVKCIVSVPQSLYGSRQTGAPCWLPSDIPSRLKLIGLHASAPFFCPPCSALAQCLLNNGNCGACLSDPSCRYDFATDGCADYFGGVLGTYEITSSASCGIDPCGLGTQASSCEGCVSLTVGTRVCAWNKDTTPAKCVTKPARRLLEDGGSNATFAAAGGRRLALVSLLADCTPPSCADYTNAGSGCSACISHSECKWSESL